LLANDVFFGKYLVGEFHKQVILNIFQEDLQGVTMFRLIRDR
jgi:hypothetical protein